MIDRQDRSIVKKFQFSQLKNQPFSVAFEQVA